MATSGRYRAGLLGRLGVVPAEVKAAGAAGGGPGVVWVHAVSVGEVLAATALVGELRAKGFAVAVSTTTQAGQELAKKRFAGCSVFYMPLDFGVLVRRYLNVLQPKLVVTMESELWPNVIRECKKGGVPLAVVNARVSDRSFPRYMRLKAVWGPLLREVSLFLAQSEETAGRLRAMGARAERVKVTGNLKFDVRAPQQSRVAELIRDLAVGRLVIVGGSTLGSAKSDGLGEEEMLIQAWEGELRRDIDAMLVIAPRHKDRFGEVEATVSEFRYVKASGFGVDGIATPTDGNPPFANNAKDGPPGFVGGPLGFVGSADTAIEIVLLDTIGDLAAVYGVADVAFVGGSLVAKGGHNPLEPAQFGVPVVMGASYENFKEIVGAMRDADAIRIVEPTELREALVDLLTNRDEATAMGERGRVVFEAQAGATARTVEGLMELIGERR